MRRLIELQVAVRAFGALIYSFNTRPRHFGVGAFLFIFIFFHLLLILYQYLSNL